MAGEPKDDLVACAFKTPGGWTILISLGPVRDPWWRSVVRPLEGTDLSRRVRAALPPGAYRPPAATAMLQVLREVCQGLVADAAHRLDRPPPRHPGRDQAAADAPADPHRTL